MEQLPLDVRYQPIKQLVLHDIQKYSIEDFVELHGLHGGVVGWSNGFIYSVGHFPPTDNLTDDALNGIEHWRVFEYAEMQKFRSEISNSDNLKCKVMDNSNHKMINEIISFVKEQNV